MTIVHRLGRAPTVVAPLTYDIVGAMAASAWSRRWLNALYRRLSPLQRNRFHKRYAKIFRDKRVHAAAGVWSVDFHGKRIQMPLTTDRFMLDWDSAVSLLGNDIEVKQTYLALLASPHPPTLFIDIGANYGTHSLLFLIHNIRTITFEPNLDCHDYFSRTCALNHVTPDLKGVALGDRTCEVELVYPKLDTWHGSVATDVVETLAARQDLTIQKVTQQRLDDYLPVMAAQRTLVKIDTEGSEFAVLRGASETLAKVKPLVIFESLKNASREAVFDFFAGRHYVIHSLPFGTVPPTSPLTRRDLMVHSGTNFIAVPLESAPEYRD